MIKLKEMVRRIIKEDIDWEKLIKPIDANFRTGSPYGLIIPKYVLRLPDKRPPIIYLPGNYSEFLNYLKKVNPKTPKNLEQCEIDFLHRRPSLVKESMQRYCGIWKAKNNKWYMDLADREYGEYEDAITYGPFDSEKLAQKYLSGFSNPGGLHVDTSGKEEPPTKSPNGRSVEKPNSRGWFMTNRD